MLAPRPTDTLVLMACSEAKIETETRVPLLALYNGPLWQDLRVHRGGIPVRNIFVLSGQLGFRDVESTDLPYNERISAEKVDRLIANGIHDPYQWAQGKARKGMSSTYSIYYVAGHPRRPPDMKDRRPYAQVIIAGSGEYRRAFDWIVDELKGADVIDDDATIAATRGSILLQRKQFNRFLRQANGEES